MRRILDGQPVRGRRRTAPLTSLLALGLCIVGCTPSPPPPEPNLLRLMIRGGEADTEVLVTRLLRGRYDPDPIEAAMSAIRAGRMRVIEYRYALAEGASGETGFILVSDEAHVETPGNLPDLEPGRTDIRLGPGTVRRITIPYDPNAITLELLVLRPTEDPMRLWERVPLASVHLDAETIQ